MPKTQPKPVQKPSLNGKHQPTARGQAGQKLRFLHPIGLRPPFPATPALTHLNIRPRPQTPAAPNLMVPIKNPDPNRPLISVEEGADKITALFAEETSNMQAYFSDLLSGMQQQLALERYEKQHLWRRVQELEAELYSLRSAGVDQKEDGSEEKEVSKNEFTSECRRTSLPLASGGNDVAPVAEC